MQAHARVCEENKSEEKKNERLWKQFYGDYGGIRYSSEI